MNGGGETRIGLKFVRPTNQGSSKDRDIIDKEAPSFGFVQQGNAKLSGWCLSDDQEI